MHAADVFLAAMQYDPLTRLPPARTALSPFDAWLQAHPTAWRVHRETDNSLVGEGQLVGLFVGEEGSGKTTQLNCEVDAFRSTDAVVVRLDFTNAAHLHAAELDRFETPLGRYLQAQVELSVADQQLLKPYACAMRRLILTSKASYTLSSAKLKYEGRLAATSDDTLANDQEIERAVSAYQGQLSHLDSGIHALESVQSISSRRALFLIDNVDHLGERKIDKLFSVLSGAISGTSIALLAIRTEHEHLARAFRHQRRVQTWRLGADGAIFQILEARIDGALEYLSANFPSEVQRALQLHQGLKRTASLIHTDPRSERLVQDWQNGNIRQMLTFLSSVAAELEVQDPTPSSIGAIRGLIYNELIRKNASPHLLDIFTPHHVRSKLHRLPFVFLRLRILAYLKRSHNGTSPVARLHFDFLDHFGIPAGVIDDALEALATKTTNSGAFVRLTSEFAVDVYGLAGSVVLLPAGRCFIEDTVYSCDFLSWIYDESGDLLIGDHSRPVEKKLAKAIATVDGKLLPSFVTEHPYLKSGREIKDDERARLDSFLQLFDYGRGKWFILRIRDELNDYATHRRLQSPELTRLSAKLTAMVGRLDSIQTTGRAVARRRGNGSP